MHIITITERTFPTCGDGCCHGEEIQILVDGTEIVYDSKFMYDTDVNQKLEKVLTDVLKILKVEAKITTIDRTY